MSSDNEWGTVIEGEEVTTTEGEGLEDNTDGSQLTTEGALALKAAPATSAGAITREQRRSRRKREVRARTISVKRMTKRELEIGRMLYPETDYNKPRNRADCRTICGSMVGNGQAQLFSRRSYWSFIGSERTRPALDLSECNWRRACR